MFTAEQLKSLRAIVQSQLPALSGPAAYDRAVTFLNNETIVSASFPDIQFDNGEMWREKQARSQERFLHGFLFFSDWYNTVLIDEKTAHAAAAAAVRIVLTWAKLHHGREDSPTMAYHDETTAQRLISLISIKPLVELHFPVECNEVIRPLMAATARLLATDDFHASGNNHGMFQDLALLYYSIMVPQEDTERMFHFNKSMSRLNDYFSSCFTTDGVHVENTPTYHLLVSKQVSNVQKIAVTAGHQDSTYYKALIRDAETYATHALMPNGTYPPISDTHQAKVAQSGIKQVFSSPGFIFASTGGSEGKAPSDRTLVLPGSGYAIYRSEWGNPNATYAIFTAAYNADYHKHSDDLSFFLRSRGKDLLSEAGPFGYDYKNPLTKYGYSQFAHNSLVVDNQSLPRTDTKKHKVTLETIEQREDGFTVAGTNARYTDVIHQRTLDIRESKKNPAFDLLDTVSSDTEHKYQLLWNIGKHLRVALRDQGFELFDGDNKLLDLSISSSTPIKLSIAEGQMKPRTLGWRFPVMGTAEKAKVVIVSFAGSNAELKTRIRLADFTYKRYDIAAADGSIAIEVERTPGALHAFKLFRGNEVVSYKGYSVNNIASFQSLATGNYRFRVFTKFFPESEPTAFTTEWTRITSNPQ